MAAQCSPPPTGREYSASSVPATVTSRRQRIDSASWSAPIRMATQRVQTTAANANKSSPAARWRCDRCWTATCWHGPIRPHAQRQVLGPLRSSSRPLNRAIIRQGQIRIRPRVAKDLPSLNRDPRRRSLRRIRTETPEDAPAHNPPTNILRIIDVRHRSETEPLSAKQSTESEPTEHQRNQIDDDLPSEILASDGYALSALCAQLRGC